MKEIVKDVECEKYVLGAIVYVKRAYNEIKEFLDEDCFYDELNKTIWKAVEVIVKRGETPEIITLVSDVIKLNDKYHPVDIMNAVENYSISDYIQQALRLRDLSVRRNLYFLGLKLSKACEDEIEDIDNIRASFKDDIDNLFCVQDENVFTMTDTLNEVYDIINKNMSKTGEITGTPTSFTMMDSKGGLQKSNLIIIAGETSQGKTSFAQALTLSAIQNNHRVAFYSMEMTKEELTARFISMNCGISSSDILYNGNLHIEQLTAIDQAVARIKSKNLYFDDRSTSNIETILSSIRSMKIRYDIHGVVVDYMQILNVNAKSGMSREQIMGDVARRLKNLAKELEIWIIALSQLNRDSQNPMPNLNRLRDSGQIAEAADIVMFVYRPEYYGRSFPPPFELEDTQGKALIDIAKGRNIGTTRFLCGFKKENTLFYSIDDITTDKDINYEISNFSPF